MDRPEMAKLLLENGADQNIKNNTGKTILDWAKERKKQEMIELLKRESKKVNH